MTTVTGRRHRQRVHAPQVSLPHDARVAVERRLLDRCDARHHSEHRRCLLRPCPVSTRRGGRLAVGHAVRRLRSVESVECRRGGRRLGQRPWKSLESAVRAGRGGRHAPSCGICLTSSLRKIDLTVGRNGSEYRAKVTATGEAFHGKGQSLVLALQAVESDFLIGHQEAHTRQGDQPRPRSCELAAWPRFQTDSPCVNDGPFSSMIECLNWDCRTTTLS